MSAIAVQRSTHSSPLPPRQVDNHNSVTPTYPSSSLAPSRASPSPQRPHNMPSSPPPAQSAHHPTSPPREAQRTSPSSTPREKSQSDAKPDSNSQPQSNGQDPSRVPQIKEEQPPSPVPSRLGPASNGLAAPAAPTRRQRPGMLDLSKGKEIPASQGGMNGRPSAPLTSKDSAGMSSLQDVGLACLSPGFQTRDPSMKSQMARSMEMREQQRQIIEARMGKKDGPGDGGSRDGGFARPPGTSRRKGPPPGLSIHAPSAQQFASEPRIVQSAPLHQSFTGLRPAGPGAAHPLSRQVLDRNDQHQHQHQHQHGVSSGEASSLAPVQNHQNSNRLPPIQDVFADEHLGSSRRPSDTLSRANSGPQLQLQQQQRRSPGHSLASQAGPQPSPGLLPPPSSAGLHPPPHASTFPRAESNKTPNDQSRRREFKSAEEAVQTLSGGREELIPKIVHYGGHQPPTPPSPLPPGQQSGSNQAISHSDGRSTSRRRTREEYERDYYEQDDARERERERQRAWEEERGRRAGPFGERPDSPETNRRKKDEFMSLCARAWDLFHS